jgi:hypothetical protein
MRRRAKGGNHGLDMTGNTNQGSQAPCPSQPGILTNSGKGEGSGSGNVGLEIGKHLLNQGAVGAVLVSDTHETERCWQLLVVDQKRRDITKEISVLIRSNLQGLDLLRPGLLIDTGRQKTSQGVPDLNGCRQRSGFDGLIKGQLRIV